MPLDLSLLEKVRHHPSGKVTSRCPACAETGSDRSGDHLVIFPDDRFACAAHGGDADHRKRIMALVGVHGDGDFRSDPERREQWRKRAEIEQQRKHHARCLEDSAQRYRREIIQRYAWTPPDVWDDSPQRIDCDLVESDPAHFLASLYQPQDVLWTGEVHHSGSDHHSDRWRSCRDWQAATDGALRRGDTLVPLRKVDDGGKARRQECRRSSCTHVPDPGADLSPPARPSLAPALPLGPIGPMTTPAVWQPGIHSRAAEHVLAAPYTVLDFDGFDGIKPSTADELDRHVLDSLGLIRWLREAMDWQLAAILWTDGKSLHAWFRTPPPEVLDSLLPVAKSLGMDAGLIGRPEHPCRLPGQRHHGTGKVSRVLWLDLPR